MPTWDDSMPGGGGGRGFNWAMLILCILLGWLLYLFLDNMTPVTGHHRPSPSPSVTSRR